MFPAYLQLLTQPLDRAVGALVGVASPACEAAQSEWTYVEYAVLVKMMKSLEFCDE